MGWKPLEFPVANRHLTASPMDPGQGLGQTMSPLLPQKATWGNTQSVYFLNSLPWLQKNKESQDLLLRPLIKPPPGPMFMGRVRYGQEAAYTSAFPLLRPCTHHLQATPPDDTTVATGDTSKGFNYFCALDKI